MFYNLYINCFEKSVFYFYVLVFCIGKNHLLSNKQLITLLITCYNSQAFLYCLFFILSLFSSFFIFLIFFSFVSFAQIFRFVSSFLIFCSLFLIVVLLCSLSCQIYLYFFRFYLVTNFAVCCSLIIFEQEVENNQSMPPKLKRSAICQTIKANSLRIYPACYLI